MREYLLIFLMAILGASAELDGFAEDFKTMQAKNAHAKYLKLQQSALETYIEDLNSAAKEAVKNDKLEEAILIKETIVDLKSQQKKDVGDPVVQLRRELKNTTWSFNRPGDPTTLRFQAENRLIRTRKTASDDGVWEAIESDTVIIKLNDNLFLLQFDDKMKSFRVLAFQPVETLYKSGDKIR